MFSQEYQLILVTVPYSSSPTPVAGDIGLDLLEYKETFDLY